jgi:hypothetical protein
LESIGARAKAWCLSIHAKAFLSLESIGALNTGFETISLHRPTKFMEVAASLTVDDFLLRTEKRRKLVLKLRVEGN